MGFKYKKPSVKIGGVTIRKNKKGYSISGKTLLGGKKTYNTETGKTTTTYKTGIKGLSYQTITDNKKKSKKKGCYVATSVYGSYDCPQVWTLRRFRDNVLAKNIFGRLFICTYYAISPILVTLFGDSYWFKKMLKPVLDKIVELLNNNNFDSTPYIDKE